MKDKKHVKYTKYKRFTHTTESKRKNMVGNNPEVEKRKALVAALNPSYISTNTVSTELSFYYTLKNSEEKEV